MELVNPKISYFKSKEITFERNGKKVTKVYSSYLVTIPNYELFHSRFHLKSFLKEENVIIKENPYIRDNTYYCIITLSSEAVCMQEDTYNPETGIRIAHLKNKRRAEHLKRTLQYILLTKVIEHLTTLDRKRARKYLSRRKSLDKELLELAYS